jgi:WD40 repeat protein
MKVEPKRNVKREGHFLDARFSAALLLPLLVIAGCGGGSSYTQPPPVVPPAPPAFQARAFPGDFFMRLPTAAGDGPIPATAYDQSLKEIFISDPNFNSVEVYSTVDGHHVGEISIPGPAGLGFSPDFSKLYVGTITPHVFVVDPVALQVTEQVGFPASMIVNGPQFPTAMPVQPFVMADGSVLIEMGSTAESGSYLSSGPLHLVRYDPSNGTFTSADPGPSGIGSNPSRTLDGKYLLVGGQGNSGAGLMVYSAAAQGYLPLLGQTQDGGVFVAANPDGSQFASVESVTGSSGPVIKFWSANLQVQNQYAASEIVLSALFSRDGKYLYLTTQLSHTIVVDTQTGTLVGYVGFAIGSLPYYPALFDVDESYHLIGGVSGGVFILDASNPQVSAPPVMALFIGPSTAANPNVGPLAGGTPVSFVPAPPGASGTDGIASTMEAYFESAPATQDVVGPYPASSEPMNFLTATTPATTIPGPVSVVLTDANNNAVFLPDAFTYGPRILRVEPNGVSAAGGDQLTIYAYGLGVSDQDPVNVSIGGLEAARVSLNRTASNNYPEQSITVTVPKGTPGWADVQLITSNGNDTLKRGIQYLSQDANVGGGPLAFAVYDSARDLFYLTGNGNTVSVFDPNTQTIGKPLQSPSASSGAVLQAEALTPDASKLLVADSTDQSVIVFDLVGGTSSAINVSLPSDPATTTVEPVEVLTAANDRAFVSVAPCVTNPVREIDLTNLTIQARADASPTCATVEDLVPVFGGASADGSTIIYAANLGDYGDSPLGAEFIWRYDAGSDTFSAPVLINDTPWVVAGGRVAVDSDGGVISLSQGVLDQRLFPLVPVVQAGGDAQLNKTGSLLYTTSGGSNTIVLSDTRNGRWDLMLKAQNTAGSVIGPIQPLAVDPSGTKVVLATQNGVSYFELAIVPLAVGTVSPATASAGATIQLRGSGFVTGTSAKIGGQPAPCTEVDNETLSCTVPALPPGSTPIALTNPDGQSYSFENAFVVQ